MIIKTTRDDHLIAWLTALAITIHIIESSLPSPLPGIKPGLANIVTILVLCLYGIRLAIWVSILRVLVGSILLGTFMSPTFILSLGGAAGTVIILAVAIKFSRRFPAWEIGPAGYCLLGAMTHISVQFFLAYFLFIQHQGLLRLLPILATSSLIFGLISGLIVSSVLRKYPESSTSLIPAIEVAKNSRLDSQRG